MSGGFQYIGPGPTGPASTVPGPAGPPGPGPKVAYSFGPGGDPNYPPAADFAPWTQAHSAGSFYSAGTPLTITVSAGGFIVAECIWQAVSSGTAGVPVGFLFRFTCVALSYTSDGPLCSTGSAPGGRTPAMHVATGLAAGTYIVDFGFVFPINGISYQITCSPHSNVGTQQVFLATVTYL